MKSSVTVSLVPEVRGGPFVFWDDLPAACRKAKALGFDAVEIFAPSADAVDEVMLRKLLDDTGLSLAAMGTGAGWVKHRLSLTSPDAAVRDRAKAFVWSIIDKAGPFGAPAIVGSMQGRSGDGVSRPAALKWLAESLNELGDYAHQYNVPLIYEPLNRYETNLVGTMAAGVELLQSLSTNNVELLADLFHMNIEETNVAAAIRDAGDLIGHVHFVDSNRRPAGLGHIDYAPIVAALRDVGYAGYLSAEAFPFPDPDAAARQTIETFRKFV
jgi:sugar phosphate isomerase/epimerase